MEMYEQTVAKEANRIVNRHKARLLSSLEDADSPAVYIQFVADSLNWLRKDIHDLMKTNENEKELHDEISESHPE